MKKNNLVIALLLLSILLIACTSKEEKAAIEYLKDSMKSPSSFKVISVDKDDFDAQIDYDTLYHISQVYGTYWIDSVLVDSIQIWRIEYPAHSTYFIEYDAANSFGAVLRNSDFIYVTKEGDTYFSKEFFSKYIDEKKYDHTESCSNIYKNSYDNRISQLLQPNEWAYSYQIKPKL